MSSDSVKENALVVDSSVTESRNDIGNSDGPESSSYRFNEDNNRTMANKEGHSHCQIGHPTGTGVEKMYNIKYFIIKSLTHQNIQLSIEKGIWATQIMNERILEKAFHNSGSVVLIFSVNMSGSFQGYAQMMSSIGWRRDNVWSEGSGKNNPWGHSFKELSPDIGLPLCELLDCKNDTDGLLNSSSSNNFSLKSHSANTPSSMRDEDCNFPSLHQSWTMPAAYPSLFSQNQAEVNNLINQRFSGTMFTELLPLNSEPSKVAGIKSHHFSGHIPKAPLDKNVASRFDNRDLYSENPLASTLTEDDFIDMSYEEYLEVHSRCRKQLHISVSMQNKYYFTIFKKIYQERNLSQDDETWPSKFLQATKSSSKKLESLGSNSHDDDR